MKTVKIADARVAYRVDGVGQGLVLVHGTGGQWGDKLGPPRAGTRAALDGGAADYSGAGETRDTGGTLSVRRLAAEVVAAVEAAGAIPFDLVGFSLGPATAMQIAADHHHPHLVRRLVLLGVFLDGADPRQRMQFRLWNDLIRTKTGWPRP